MTSLASIASSSPDPETDRTADLRVAIALLDTVQLEVADEHSWRVCDRHIARGPGRFLASLEEKDDQFEVTNILENFGLTEFPTMWDALAHILETRVDRSSVA